MRDTVIGRTTCLLTAVMSITAAIGCGGEDVPGNVGAPGKEDVGVVRSALMPSISYVDTWNAGATDAYAFCPSGQTLIGGGFLNPSANRINYSAPGAAIPVSWWQTGMYGTDSFASEALCLPSATTDAAIGVYGSGTIPAHSTACAYATCPSGSVMTGGGAKAGDGGYIYASYALTTRQWVACGANDTNNSISVGSWGRCLAASQWPTASVFNVEANTFVSPGTSGTAIAACPANSAVSGNGFNNDIAGQTVVTESDFYQNWIGFWQTSSHATLKNNSSSGVFVRAVATCLQL